ARWICPASKPREAAQGGFLCKRLPVPVELQPKIEMLFRLPFRLLGRTSRLLHKTAKRGTCSSIIIGGALASTHRWKRRRHVEDGSLASLKTGPKNKRRQRRSRSRGLIDRDVCRGTPATTANVDSRLANRWSDRAGS